MPGTRVRGKGTSSRKAGVASLPWGLSLNALRAGPSDRLRGGPPMRASGPSFMEMPFLTRGRGPGSQHLPWLLYGNTTVGVEGRGLERAPQEGEEAAWWRGGRSGSVVDPESSGHLSGGGIWRQREVLAPKLRSRSEQNSWSLSWF